MRSALVSLALAAVAALGLALPSLDAPRGAHVNPDAPLSLAQVDDLRVPSLTCAHGYYADYGFADTTVLTCAPATLKWAADPTPEGA